MSCIRISSSSRERRAPVATGLAFALLVAGCGSPTRPVQPEPAGGGEDAAAAILERGRVAYEAGDSQGARQHYLSLRDTLGHPPADAVLFARLELELGRLEADEARYEAAAGHCGVALDALEGVDGDADELRAEILYELGWFVYRLGEYAEAEDRLRRALAIRERLLGTAAPEVAAVLDRLGVVHRELGEYPTASPLFERALEILAAAPDANLGLRTTIYNDLGGLEYYKSDFAAAGRWFQLALEGQLTQYGRRDLRVSKTLNNLGVIYQELGDYERARSTYLEALEIKEALQGPDHPGVASTVHNIAAMEDLVGDFAAAERLYRRALATYESSLGPEHLNVAIVANALGWLRFRQGDIVEAQQLLERSLEIKEKVLASDHGWIAETLLSLAPVYAAQGDPERADALLRRAVTIAAGAGELELLWEAYAGYGKLLAGQDNLPAAVFFGKQAVNSIQSMRAHLTPLERSLQRGFLEQREYVYRDLTDRLITLGRLAEAQQVLDLLKEEEYFDFLRRAPAPGEHVNEPVSYTALELPWASELAGFADNLTTIQEDLNALLESGAKRESPEGEARVAALRAAARQQRQAFSARLAALGAALNVPQSGPPAGFADATLVELQATLQRLGHDAVLIHYLITDERLRILLTTAGSQVHRDSAVPRAELNRLIFSYRQALQDPGTDPRAQAQLLYRLLLAPIEAELEAAGARMLMASLDGALRYIPLAALHDGSSYVIERYSVAMFTAAARLGLEHRPATHWQAAGLGVSQSVGAFRSLPMVPVELDGIVRRGQADADGVLPGVIYLDEDFTRQNLAASLEGGYPLIHIASHFVFNPGTLRDSFLVLGGGARLNLEELRNGAFPFDGVDLLTLSACDTAVGGLDSAGRELESFGTLAQKQGARSVLATLWPVADRSTGRFMQRLYLLREQHGLTKAEALRQAQLRFLRGQPGSAAPALELRRASLGDTQPFRHDPRAPYAHPFFWAPFLLIGNWL